MSDDINRPMPLAPTGRRRRRIRIPVVSLLVFIISAVVAAPAAAASKTVDGGTVVHATALWSGLDEQGNKVVTQLDLLDGIVYDETPPEIRPGHDDRAVPDGHRPERSHGLHR